jgi:hypothetical protein
MVITNHVVRMSRTTIRTTGATGVPMTDATLQMFRDIAAAMTVDPTDWQWIGPHASQRMFGITRTRAEEYARRHGGTASPMGDKGTR